MYAIKRKSSIWLCTTAREAFEVHAVQIRLQGKHTNFAVFEQCLEEGSTVKAGVIGVFKCSDAIKCEECPRYGACDIFDAVKATEKEHAQWASFVESIGGNVF